MGDTSGIVGNTGTSFIGCGLLAGPRGDAGNGEGGQGNCKSTINIRSSVISGSENLTLGFFSNTPFSCFVGGGDGKIGSGGKGAGLNLVNEFAASILKDKDSRWKGSVGVSEPVVSMLSPESVEFLRWVSSFMSFRICWRRPGVNISSTSVRNILPLKTSTTFVVTSVRFHRGGVDVRELGRGGGVFLPRSALPNTPLLFFLLAVTEGFRLGVEELVTSLGEGSN